METAKPRTVAGAPQSSAGELTALRGHVSDAAIAAQIPPPSDAEWLAKCALVRVAQDKMKADRTVNSALG